MIDHLELLVNDQHIDLRKNRMSTGAKLDSTAAGGIGSIKDRLKALNDNIKAENDKADRLIKEKETAHRNYCKIVGRQQHIKDKMSSKEDEIEKIERKIKELESRLIQKEEFIKESKSFHKHLTKVTPSEGDRAHKEKELEQYKALYNEAHHKYMQAKEKKLSLEQHCENVELRGRDVQRKVDDLARELENNLMEEGRRGEQCKQTMDSCFRLERNMIGVQKMLDEMMKRKEDASKKVKTLTEKIDKVDEELEATSHERKCFEATIREILVKSKEC